MLRLLVARDHATGEWALLRRELAVLRGQRETLPPHRRPDYSPEQRLAIIQLMRLRGWNVATVAEHFVLHPHTVREWRKAVAGRGHPRLLAPAVVWNHIDDLVRWATHVERRRRYLLAAKLADKTARSFARRSLAVFAALPPSLFKTLTADNGKEFVRFKLLERGLGLRVYFARPYAAWERGACENTNGLIRDYFPKGTDFRLVSDRKVAQVVRSLNNRPRKCLGYQTPAEVISTYPGVALRN